MNRPTGWKYEAALALVVGLCAICALFITTGAGLVALMLSRALGASEDVAGSIEMIGSAVALVALMALFFAAGRRLDNDTDTEGDV